MPEQPPGAIRGFRLALHAPAREFVTQSRTAPMMASVAAAPTMSLATDGGGLSSSSKARAVNGSWLSCPEPGRGVRANLRRSHILRWIPSHEVTGTLLG